MKKGLVWFRNDLRLHDQVALSRALDECDEVLPIYCLDPRHFEKRPLGFPKTGSFRAKFLLEALEDLRASLVGLGSNLLVLQGKPEAIIPQVCVNHDCQMVYGSKEVGQEETDVEDALEKELWKSKIQLHLEWQSTLYHIEDIPWPVGNLPNIFTNFRKACERESEVRPALSSPTTVPTIMVDDYGDLPSLSLLGLDSATADSRAAIIPVGGESHGVERLQQYFWQKDELKNYKYTRNGLLGEDYSSKFSPWLALGCLSPRYIYEEVRKYEQSVKKNQSTYWLVFELIWRDYFRLVARKYGSQIFLPGGIKRQRPEMENNNEVFELWRTGQTGVPFIDANMRELLTTGFMSIRGRQNVASFLIKDLQINWTWGAEWFESQLIDYDVCSNWGNWLYVAGVGNDPRENRYFNIMSQAMKYDAKGEYVRIWLPELVQIPGYKIHHPAELPDYELKKYGVQIGHHYHKSIVDMSKWLV